MEIYLRFTYSIFSLVDLRMDAAVKGKSSQIGRARQFLTEIIENEKRTDKYTCNLCNAVLSGASPSNLVAHFKARHKEIFESKIASSIEDALPIQRLKILHSCVELVAINSQPFSLLSSSGFRSLIQRKIQELQLAGCGINLSDHHVYEIKEKVISIASEIKEMIKMETKNRIISVMVDGATRNGRSIFGINIQYKIEGELKVVTLGMRELDQAHTAHYLSKVLQEVLAEYEINLNQVISITTDNGSNMLAMVMNLENKLFSEDLEQQQFDGNETNIETTNSNYVAQRFVDDDQTENEIARIVESKEMDDYALEEIFDTSSIYQELLEKLVIDIRKKSGNHHLFMTSIKCAAHTLQLAVNDALKKLNQSDQNIISLCRVVGKFLRLQSTRNAMKQARLVTILPKLDVETRWSSTYLMVS